MQPHRSPSLSIGVKILMIAASFSLPIGVLVYLMVDSIDANITTASMEQAGNAYLRPLEESLMRVQDHQWVSWQCAQPGAAQDQCHVKLAAAAGQVSDALERAAAVNVRYGELLKFTPVELKKRGREHQTIATVSREWAEMAATASANGVVPRDQYEHLIADLRTMITHAGDTSNLILDPDLDSYYLMDATLVALPQTQDRMASAALRAEAVLEGQPPAAPGADDARIAVAVDTAELQADREHVSSSTHTALNEDENFYGVSPTFAPRVEPSLKLYEKAAKHYEELTREASRLGSHVDRGELASAAQTARRAAFDYWSVAVDELDVLLSRRIQHYASSRTNSLVWTGSALAIAAGLALFFARSITEPLAALMRSLGPGATLLGECVTRISDVSHGESVDPEEAQIICGELDAHAASMRQAVIELARHVSGANRESADRVVV